MDTNLDKILDYINEKLIYGQKLKDNELKIMLRKFNIDKSDRDIVLEELKELNIQINPTTTILKDVTKNTEKELNSKCIVEKSNYTDEINSKTSEDNEDMLTQLDELLFDDANEYEDLDDILESDEFNERLKNTIECYGPKDNIDLLEKFNITDTEEEKSRILNHLLGVNEKLVLSIVNNYRKFQTSSFDWEDMQQAGMEGLMEAVNKFDLDKETQLSTYATYWIKQKITRQIGDCSTTIRVPIHMRELIIKCKKIENDYFFMHGERMTTEELAHATEESVTKILAMKEACMLANLNSLDHVTNESGDLTLLSLVKDTESKSVEAIVSYSESVTDIKELLADILKDREREVIELRYGLNGNVPHTLEMIGDQSGVTRERIRQIEAKAIRKLQSSPKVMRQLRGYLDND